MTKKLATVVVLLAGMSLNPSSALAEVAKDGKGSTTWKAGVDGVEIEWDAAGNLNRLYSKVSQAVEIKDRQGVNKAYKVAELKANAAIVKFIKKSVTSAEIATEINNELSKASQQSSSKSGETLTKTNERTMVSNFTEVVTSVSRGDLRGVIVLERGYDEKAGEVWVVVGVSERTKNAASQVDRFVNDAGESNGSSNSTGTAPVQGEVKQSKNIGNF